MMLVPCLHGMDIYPGEHLLGALGRTHLYSGHVHFLTTAQSFSADVGRLSPYIPCRPIYRAFADLLSPLFGKSPQVILQDHSAYALYLSLSLTAGHSQTEYGNSVFNPKGLKPIRYAKSWRWCPSCVSEDLEAIGIPYWRATHQLPTVLNCQTHARPLHVSCERHSPASSAIQHNLAPPIVNSCQQCGSSTEITTVNGALHWIEEAVINVAQGKLRLPSLEDIQLQLAERLGVSDVLGISSLKAQRARANALLPLLERVDRNAIRRIFAPNHYENPRFIQHLFSFYKTLLPRLGGVQPIAILLMIDSLFEGFDNYVAEHGEWCG